MHASEITFEFEHEGKKYPAHGFIYTSDSPDVKEYPYDRPVFRIRTSNSQNGVHLFYDRPGGLKFYRSHNPKKDEMSISIRKALIAQKLYTSIQ